MMTAVPSMIDLSSFPASVHVSRFECDSGYEDFHLTVQLKEGVAGNLEVLLAHYAQAVFDLGLSMDSAVFRRFFCADLRNQAGALRSFGWSNPENSMEPCAVSWVEQPPLAGGGIALWAYHVSDPRGPLDKQLWDSTLTLKRDGLLHHWTTGLADATTMTSFEQTEQVFKDYNKILSEREMVLSNDVIRTWLFVRDIDHNYKGLGESRAQYFNENGLRPDTHYISSTGIEGGNENRVCKVLMDAYAVSGIREEQIHYLTATKNLGRTDAYGITFERGTQVSFSDRRAITISGTASINPQGEIMHEGDVLAQMDRALENIEALLNDVGGTFDAMQVCTVYLRHAEDRKMAQQRMRERFPKLPFVVVTAPVCRPGWLIEIEGEALLPPRRL